MTTPPNANAVSDARLAEVRAWLDVAKMPGTPLALQADARAALRELQARRAADAAAKRTVLTGGDEPAPSVVEALRECRSAIETVVSTGNVSGPFRRHVLPVLGMIQKALAAHDARQPQRDPVQAVLAEVAALAAKLDGGPIARSTTANARHQIRQNNVRRAAQSVALVLRLDREAREKGAAT